LKFDRKTFCTLPLLVGAASALLVAARACCPCSQQQRWSGWCNAPFHALIDVGFVMLSFLNAISHALFADSC
jgi:hypothetical protein